MADGKCMNLTFVWKFDPGAFTSALHTEWFRGGIGHFTRNATGAEQLFEGKAGKKRGILAMADDIFNFIMMLKDQGRNRLGAALNQVFEIVCLFFQKFVHAFSPIVTVT